MGWPKGKPRKGYVNKDGTTHANKKDRLGFDSKPLDTMVSFTRVPTNHPDELTVEVTSVLHGMTGVAIVRPCPMCLYAYADGGYCPDCGWSLPVYTDPYGTNSGGRK